MECDGLGTLLGCTTQETLRLDGLFEVIKTTLAHECGEKIAEPAEKKDDRMMLWKKFWPSLKRGTLDDPAHRVEVAGQLRFLTSETGDEQIRLKEYDERMREGQRVSHYIICASIAVVSC